MIMLISVTSVVSANSISAACCTRISECPWMPCLILNWNHQGGLFSALPLFRAEIADYRNTGNALWIRPGKRMKAERSENRSHLPLQPLTDIYCLASFKAFTSGTLLPLTDLCYPLLDTAISSII